MSTIGSPRALNLLVVTDLHDVHAAPADCQLPERRCELGRVLLRKALLRLKHAGSVFVRAVLSALKSGGIAFYGREACSAALRAAVGARPPSPRTCVRRFRVCGGIIH
jgi:hypothetical protein